MKNEEKELIKDTIIIAPHPDDEVIGCYEQLILDDKPIIIYSGELDADRREEALHLKKHVDLKLQLFLMTVPQSLLNLHNTFYFPDPIYEVHPEHRQWGFLGEQLARAGFNVIFYSIIMSAPYIHRLDDKAKDKKELLDKAYPSQKDLWKYDNKYFLFEGKCKWIF